MGTVVVVLRVIAGTLPSTLLVVAVFLLAVLALALNAERRTFVLDVTDKMLTLAATLIGVRPDGPPAAGRHL